MRLHPVPLPAATLFLPLLAATLFFPVAHAQTGSPPPAVSRSIGLPEALASAFASNPELAAARHEVAATEGARQQSAVRPDPTLSLDVEDTRRSTRATTLSLSQAIELGGKRAARIAVADRSLDVAEARFAARRAEVAATVTGAYFDALVAQERLRLAEASLSVARSGSDAAARRVVAGKVSPIDETRSRVAEAGVRLELRQAVSDLALALHTLRVAMGVPSGAFDAVSGTALEVPAAVSDAELALRLPDAPASREAQRDAARFAALAEVEHTRRTPDLTVSLGAKRDAEAGRNMAVLGLAMPLPVFDGNRGAEREALRRHDKALADARSVATRVELDALRAQERLQTARAEVSSLQADVLPGAQAAYDAAAKGFDLGKFGVLDVLDAQRTLLQAKGQYLRALADTHRSRIELDRLLGEPVNTLPADAPKQP